MECKSISASRYKTYGLCEMMYALDYVLDVQEAKKWATECGSLCHELYESLAAAIKRGEEPKVKATWYTIVLEAYRNSRTVKNKFGDMEVIPPLWTLTVRRRVH